MKRGSVYFLITAYLFISTIILIAQDRVVNTQSEPLTCGSVVEGEYSDNIATDEYLIDLNPGDQLLVSITPIGDQLSTRLELNDPNGNRIYWEGLVERSPVMRSGVLSARGRYTIQASNWSRGSRGEILNRGGIGVYTLFVSCTLRDGTVIEPGDVAPQISATSAATPTQIAVPTIVAVPNFGLPSLAPVDFSAGVTVPMTLGGAPNVGSISEGFVGIFGYTFEGSEGQPFSLQFTRTAGNLNLGLAVITASNEVAFQASLINSNVLITQFNLPATDTYTIGVYRIELNPPDVPQATSFEITGTLN